MSSTYRIVQATSDEERSEVYRLRYKVFVDELHYQISGVSRVEGIVLPSDRDALLLLAYDDRGEAAGTITVNRAADSGFDESLVEHYQLADFTQRFSAASLIVFHKLLVLRAHRGGRLVLDLGNAALMGSLTREHRFLFVDCSPYLVSYYERLGLRRYAPHFTYDGTGIISVPLCAVLGDVDYLRRIGSPLADALSSVVSEDPEAKAYFERRWGLRPGVGGFAPTSLPDAPAPISPSACELFEGVAQPVLESIIARGQRVRFERQSTVIRSGSLTTELVLVLDGYLEVVLDVTTPEGTRRRSIATRGPGTLLGEMSMLTGRARSATIVALTHGEVLVLERHAVERMAVERPELAVHLYRNIARILAERLRNTEIWVTESPPL